MVSNPAKEKVTIKNAVIKNKSEGILKRLNILKSNDISEMLNSFLDEISLDLEKVKDDYFIYKVLSHSRKQISKIEITPIR